MGKNALIILPWDPDYARETVSVDIDRQEGEPKGDVHDGADVTINANEADPVAVVNDITQGEGVDVAIEAIGGTGIGIVQALGMVRHNGILAIYGDNYIPVKEFCFNRFHEDGLEVRNLNGVHYTRLRSVENMREAYRAVRRGVFNIDIILENSVRYRLDELPTVFKKETETIDQQASLKTIITP